MSLVCFVTPVLSTLRDSVPGARKSHLYLPRSTTPTGKERPPGTPVALVQTGLRPPNGERNPALALAAPAGVGQGQGVFENKHSQTIQERSANLLSR